MTVKTSETGARSSDQARLSGTVWSGRRFDTGHERHAVVGPDGEQAGPRPVLSGRPNGTKVIILGAGVSGMAVGYELGKLGYSVRVLEARDRVGGVNWTLRRGSTHTELGPNGETQVCNFDEGLYHNGGPWRLPSLAHRRPWILQGAGRAARGLHQRERVVLLLLRRGQHRSPGQQARAACAR